MDGNDCSGIEEILAHATGVHNNAFTYKMIISILEYKNLPEWKKILFPQ
jgi:hypothetical protein